MGLSLHCFTTHTKLIKILPSGLKPWIYCFDRTFQSLTFQREVVFYFFQIVLRRDYIVPFNEIKEKKVLHWSTIHCDMQRHLFFAFGPFSSKDQWAATRKSPGVRSMSLSMSWKLGSANIFLMVENKKDKGRTNELHRERSRLKPGVKPRTYGL